MLIGGLISYLLVSFGYHSILEKISFNSDVFFYGCLPPIVFASAYNMDRKVFFENFSAVIIFGVLGTVLQFFLFAGGLYWINSLGIFKIAGVAFKLSLYEILLMCSLICSSDPVAAIAVVR